MKFLFLNKSEESSTFPTLFFYSNDEIEFSLFLVSTNLSKNYELYHETMKERLLECNLQKVEDLELQSIIRELQRTYKFFYWRTFKYADEQDSHTFLSKELENIFEDNNMCKFNNEYVENIHNWYIHNKENVELEVVDDKPNF